MDLGGHDGIAAVEIAARGSMGGGARGRFIAERSGRGGLAADGDFAVIWYEKNELCGLGSQYSQSYYQLTRIRATEIQWWGRLLPIPIGPRAYRI